GPPGCPPARSGGPSAAGSPPASADGPLPAALAPPTIRASILPGRTARRSTRRT
ncbi:Rubredoxin, partial [Dysosmobacter welbionis]